MSPRPALDGIRVLDLSTEPGGAYCARLFAGLGADVLEVEPPEGDPARRRAPFVGEPHPERSAAFAFLNTGKRSTVLDPGQAWDLAGDADIVVGGLAQGPAWHARLARRNPRVTTVAVTTFGCTGPYRDLPATDLTLSAFVGVSHHTGERNGTPVRIPGSLLRSTAGAAAAVAALAVHRHARACGHGQHVDTSVVEAALNGTHQQTAIYTYTGSRVVRGWLDAAAAIWRTKDGWVFAPPSGLQDSDAQQMLEVPDALRALLDPEGRAAPVAELLDGLRDWFQTRTSVELCERAQLVNLTWAPILDPAQVPELEQMRERGFAHELEHPVLGRAWYPARYFVSDELAVPEPTPAPLLGEHTGQGWLERDDLPAPRASRDPQDMPLRGMRVLSTEHWAALPQATKTLAALGAEIVVVERVDRPQRDLVWGLFYEGSRQKRFTALDLTTPAGAGVFRRLVARADVVADNFSPRVMGNLGLQHAALREVKPDIVTLSLSGFGHRGPWFLWKGHNGTAEAVGGQLHMTGHAEGPPVRGGSSPLADVVTGMHAAWSVLAALEHRDRTGEGAFLDVGMVEPNACALGELVVHGTATGVALSRDGTRDPNADPSGCYPCAGEDRWVAIACETDGQRDGLARVLDGCPSDEAIAAWTSGREREDAVRACREAGVPVSLVADARDILTDPHLVERGTYEAVEHAAGVGRRLHLGPPWKLSRTPASTLVPAPVELGRDNAYVLGELAGLGPGEIASLERDGVTASLADGRPRAHQIVGVLPPAPGPPDEDHLERLGLA